MTELTPSFQVEAIQRSLLSYLTTTFALVDEASRTSLSEFLNDPVSGLFKGAFVRLRLPFRPASTGWQRSLDWYGGLPPYGHQAAAFERLSTSRAALGASRPQPTLVTTGTGSGKTESFLFPILDHVLRAKRAGVTGMKAIILYPMNALANDQAKRLTSILTGDDTLSGVTAAIYTGQNDPLPRTRVSAKGLITDRKVMRSDPPDVLLTNYKMLDQLLLRADDAPLWQKSAMSLQYLVLDEFHTYDGAQGTDVSMLLRRLGTALKSYWQPGDLNVSGEDRRRPLGQITPVATSATLGDGGDPARMLQFAETVFGEPFGADAVVTESRVSIDEWIGDAADVVESWELEEVDVDRSTIQLVNRAVEALGDNPEGSAVAEAVASQLWRPSTEDAPTIGAEDRLLTLLRGHQVTRWLLSRAVDAISVRDLATDLLGDHGAAASTEEQDAAEAFVTALLAAFSHVRAIHGRIAPSVDLHLWVRELTRIDRAVSDRPEYIWADDGPLMAVQSDDVTDTRSSTYLPALYCRHCGRSGWGLVLAPTGSDLHGDDSAIRAQRTARNDRFRPAIHAPAEGEMPELADGHDVVGLLWLSTDERRLLARPSVTEEQLRTGAVVPVLTHVGDDAAELSLDDTCPSCLQKDGIRFLGSAIATMLSVTISTLFGDPTLDPEEKKALVFTDSVQDAAHRAGFVEARSHSLTFRSVIREAVGDAPSSLDELVEEMLRRAGDDRHRRYRLVPPSLTGLEEFTPFWEEASLRRVPPKVRERVRRRLLLDVSLEFGLQSRTGRTLERTGSVTAEVDASEGILLRAADDVLDAAGGTGTLGSAPARAQRIAWVRGVLERMRERGAVHHLWFVKYQQDDGNRYSIWGGRPRSDGMPAFPAGRAAPAFPRVGGAKLDKNVDLDPVTSPQSWYARWAGRNLGVAPGDGARFAKMLFERLAHLGLVDVVTSKSAAQVYELKTSSILVAPVELDDLTGGLHRLVCSVCRSSFPGSLMVTEQLSGAPCLVARCGGTLGTDAGDDNFYRRLYESTDIRRVVAREHTSMLDDAVRLGYEEAFKGAGEDPQAPNVLVATPTLEMGIDIGDLSTVMLSSLPRSVASYLQRVGRAGRLTGNSLNLAFVTGRGDQLPRLGDPLSVINGAVVPPATYLDAEEILRRQFIAHLADHLARDVNAPHPKSASGAIGSVDEGSFLRALLNLVEVDPKQCVDAFLAGFPSLSDLTRRSLLEWASPQAGVPDSSGLARRVVSASQSWNHTVETLNHRRKEIQLSLPALQQAVANKATATDADRRAHRTAQAALRLVQAQLSDLRAGYWIGVLEEHGLLPNYTLLDDGVTLDVTLSWTDPDTGDFRNDPFSYRRGGTQALRDFAPGATFYANGHRIAIDALDLGHDGESVRQWLFCPACGYAAGPDPAPVAACPRCGSTGVADTKQRLDVVELEHVYSAMRRDDALIGDDRDERMREQFSVVTAADVDPAKVVRQWFVEGYTFGAKYLRDQTIRWINVGRSAAHGMTRPLAGAELPVPLFRVCEACGQLDKDPRVTRPDEHRPWCIHRTATAEHTRGVALSRTLRTEGLVLRLPASVTLGDAFAVPSLSAALLLGLRRRMGGSPDHLQIVETVDPTFGNGTDNASALLLHDIVPGGTGYLAELADPRAVWRLLRDAWETVRDCPCREEDRLSCHRCLLPFAAPHQVRWVARASAERHLRDILAAGGDHDPADEPTWSWTEEEPDQVDPESTLEQRFRKIFLERLAAVGATVDEQPTVSGNRLLITMRGGRKWRLEPQQIVAGSKPDFILRCSQAGIPEVAVFTDGWRWHASPQTNRIADDAVKRENLRLSNRVVLGVSWQDLDDAENGKVQAPDWWATAQRDELMASSGGQLTPSLLDLVSGGPVDFLMSWIQAPDPEGLQRLAHWLPWFLIGDSVVSPISGSPVAAAATTLDGDAVEVGDNPTWTWSRGPMTFAATIVDPATATTEVAVVLDDREAAVERPDHRDAWREWLRLSNLLNLRTAPTTISCRTEVDLGATPAAASEPTPATGSMPAEWQELYELGTELERPLIRELAAADISLPEQGLESVGGIALPLAWPAQRVVVDVSFSTDDRIELETAGWHVVSPVIDKVREALTVGKD
ncbi:DEAD/DEAH box helicase [Kineococcus sp. T13]|uniref:DEAD/DEAH box helicase n=1 Tax=Kineococcus vitellinus TaxID=2696565 RepID=UPI001411C4CF|nr:DEAD/DEAH box helicase [Kineococcus vitellinus]NAZ74032.1 DEAD/DEAH box helicase [Kineococcus vitellinus]